MENELLVRRAQHGDAAAFEQLVTPHEAMVWRVCWRLVQNTEDARDAAQETMLRAWRSIGAFRGDAALSTWLYRIAVSCASDLLRRAKARPAQSMDALRESGFDPADPAPRPDEAVERRMDRDLLRAALSQLPPDQRAALLLSACEGRSYEEIAALTGVAVGTVKSRINRARQHLSKILRQSEQSGAMCVK